MKQSSGFAKGVSMHWLLAMGMFILSSCGGTPSAKKSTAKVKGSDESSDGKISALVTVKIELFDNQDLLKYVPDVKSKMNAYQINLLPKDPDCDSGELISGDLNEDASVEIDLDRNCAFNVFLRYGYGVELAGGDTTVGDTTVGDTTVGDTTVGDTTVGDTTVGDTTVGDTTVGGTADGGTADGGTADGGESLGLVAYEGVGGVKEYLDATCALSGCHVSGAVSPDLSSYTAVTALPNTVSESIEYMNGVSTPLMPIGGSVAANAAGIQLLQDWSAGGFVEGVALALQNSDFQVAYYESEPIELTTSILESHDTLTLKFKLCATEEGKASGFSDAAIKCIQGGSYSRDESGSGTGNGGSGTTDGGTTDGGTADGGTADGGTADGGTADGGTADGGTADGGTVDPGVIVGDPNSGVTFDDVRDLFITNPASQVAGCTAMGCHGEVKGPSATTDYSTYQNIVDAENANPGIILRYVVELDLMPKGVPYAAAQKQLIADWIAAEMPPGADAALIPDPNAVITSQVVQLFSAGVANCVDCHGNAGGVNLTGDANLKANAAQSLMRLDNAAAGNQGPMPPGGAILNADQIEMIRTWIDNGMPDVAPLISPEAAATP